MDLWLWLVGALLLFAVLWAAWTFNTLVRRRNGVDESWATIGVELKRRHDLIPSIVDAVRGYAGFEQSVLTRVAESRSRAVGGVDAQAETSLTDAIRSLFAVAEAYPDLKATEQFQSLQQQLALTEDRIAYARAVYNAWVTDYETARQSFPATLVAGVFRFDRRAFFEADITSRGEVDVSLRGDAATA